MTAHLLLMPGFDGTGELFAPLQAALPSSMSTSVVRYSNETTLEACVATAACVLPEERTVLVAESFSGPVALMLMKRFPDRIIGAVLCATFAMSPFRTLVRTSKYLPEAFFGANRSQRSMVRVFCLNGEGDHALIDQAVAVASGLSAATVKRRLMILADVDLRPVLTGVSQPVLYLRAHRDRIVSPALGDQLVHRLSTVIIKDIDGPHLLLQARALECAAMIAEFTTAIQLTPQSA